MKGLYKFLTSVCVAGLLLGTAGANALPIFDFREMADNPGDANYQGEGGFSALNVSISGINLTATGTSTADFTSWLTSGDDDLLDNEFAYLATNAGLGVCSNLDSGNQCTSSGDSNISVNEVLLLTFDTTATLSSISFYGYAGTNQPFPADHDDDFALFIDGVYVGEKSFDGGVYNGPITGTQFAIAADNFSTGSFTADGDQFYISALCVDAQDSGCVGNDIPAPATLALFGIGLAGLGWSRRKKA
jgi:hypothetical protein